MLDNFRVETTTVGQYLSSVESEEIKVDQAVQRSFCWKSEMMNALIYSALSSKAVYIPNLILAEQKKDDGIKITYVVDGGQRTETLRRFRYGGYKITKKLRNYIIPYKEKMVDENGKVMRDGDGNIKWELKEFDIRNKTYNSLPEDLKNRFNNYLLAKAVYQDCTPDETSELVLMYNNHLSMNTAQKALTYIGRFAEKVKNIKNNSRFLMDGTALTEKEKNAGIWEKVICECVMAINHFDSWKNKADKMDDFLNENSSEDEFDVLEQYFDRLAPFSDKLNNLDIANLFLQKNLCVWMMLFDRFSKLNLPDEKFGEFLNAFAKDLKYKEINENTWESLEGIRQPKDKKTIQSKIDYLEAIMMDFLGIDYKKNDEDTTNDNDTDTDKYVFDFCNTDLISASKMSQLDMKTTALETLKLLNNNIEEALIYVEDANSWLLEVENEDKAFNKKVLPAIIAFVKHMYEKYHFKLEDKEIDKKGISILNDYLSKDISKKSMIQNYKNLIAYTI